MMMKRLLLVLTLFSLTVSGQVFGASFEEVTEILADNYNSVGTRQTAMGGAGIMSFDGNALYYNPANLARIPRVEFNVGFTMQRFHGSSDVTALGSGTTYTVEDDKNNTRLSSAILSIPYPTYRGSMVFGIGLTRDANFDRVTNNYFAEDDNTNLERYVETGGIYKWGFGFGIDLSPRLAVGSAVYLYHGKHEVNFESDVYQNSFLIDPLHQYLDNSYLGFGLKAGMAYQISHLIGIGMTVELPVVYNVEQNATITYGDEDFPLNNTYYTDYSFTEYDITRPFIFAAGLSFRHNKFTFLADGEYIDWTQISYGNNADMENDYNDEMVFYYRDVFKLKLGGEYVIPSLGLSLRSGYFLDPLPYKNQYVEKDRKGFTAGFGLLVDQVVMIDLAYVHADQTLHRLVQPAESNPYFSSNFDIFDDSKINQFFLSASYRF